MELTPGDNSVQNGLELVNRNLHVLEKNEEEILEENILV